jgi:hypothetical protein
MDGLTPGEGSYVVFVDLESDLDGEVEERDGLVGLRHCCEIFELLGTFEWRKRIDEIL